jgi:hypothetical protein
MVCRFLYQAWRPAASLAYSARYHQIKVSEPRRYYEVKSTVEESLSRRRSLQAPLRLLSFDGGGVRGLSSLLILEELMKNVARLEKKSGKLDRNYHKPLKPCRYFDLIGGQTATQSTSSIK